MRYYSPLRYPGGKAKIAPFMQKVISVNHLSDGIYVEPFAGGAGTALSLLLEEYVHTIILNDIDRSIYAFWYSILNYTDEFCSLIESSPLTISEWRRQKEIQKEKETADLLCLGFSTFYLNRTNRSGILDGGVIGGINQTGKWKIDARFNKSELIQRIRRIANYKNRIQVYNLDAIEFIREVIIPLPKKTLIYFDPPYYNKGPWLYINHYKPEDHQHLKKVIKENIIHHWIVTYDNTPEIKDLYSEFETRLYSLNYSAANNGKGCELMFFSPGCVIPDNSMVTTI